jgi:diacylglycerol kinase family enzyme
VKLLVLNNLSSGYGEGAIYDFVRAVAQAGDEIVIRAVNGESDFQALLADAKDFDTVVASGGDGTVASVCYLLKNSGVPILPFPAGTANLLAQNVLSPTEPHALAKLVREGRMLDFDIGELLIGDKRFGFSMMAGCGYDAVIMNNAKANKKRLGPVAYFKAAFDNPNPQISHFSIDIDGEHIEKDGVGVVLVNFSKIQFDISLAVQNLPRDGMLDVLVLTTETAWNLLPAIVGAAIDHSGDALKQSDAVTLYRGSEISIVADPPMGVQYDGEAVQLESPFIARVLPGATKLIVSEEGYEQFS